jgi:hypothetical protein
MDSPFRTRKMFAKKLSVAAVIAIVEKVSEK